MKTSEEILGQKIYNMLGNGWMTTGQICRKLKKSEGVTMHILMTYDCIAWKRSKNYKYGRWLTGWIRL